MGMLSVFSSLYNSPIAISQDVGTSDYHPHMAVASADGCLYTTNQLKTIRRGPASVRSELGELVMEALISHSGSNLLQNLRNGFQQKDRGV